MSPRFEVDVSQEQAAAFEQMLQSRDGIIRWSSKPLAADYKPEATQYLAGYASLVAHFQEPKDPETETRVINGARKLLLDLYGHGFEQTYGITPILETPEEMAAFRETLGGIFLECTATEPSFFTKNDPQKPVWNDRQIIKPAQADALMQRYGLLNGAPRGYDEIAQNMDSKHPKYIRLQVEEGKHKLRGVEKLRSFYPRPSNEAIKEYVDRVIYDGIIFSGQ